MEEKTMIFKDVTFYIVGDIPNDVINLLISEGGKRDTYLSEMVSHVIADSTVPDEYSEAKEIFERPIVSSDWVRLSVICKKQLPKERFALEGCLFSGVVACPSRLDITDARSLWSMLIYNGGRCQLKFDKNVTHLIASGTDGLKYTEGLFKEKVKIVTPDWVCECIKKEAIQDETIYHPRLIVYPKPETPPPKPKPPIVSKIPDLGDLSNLIGQQMALGGPSPFARRRKSSSDDSPRNGSRPGTPSAKEALARMVSSRLQASGKSSDPADISATLASMFPHGQYPMPGVPQSPGHTMQYGQTPMQGMHFGMGMGQGHGHSPTRGQSPIQGHPLAHVPHQGQAHPQNQMFMQNQMPHMGQGQMPPQSPGHMQSGQGQGLMQMQPQGQGQLPCQNQPQQMQNFQGQIPLHHQGPPPQQMTQGQMRFPGQAQIPRSQGQLPNMMQSQMSSPPGQMRPQMQGQFPVQGHRMPQGHQQRPPHPQMQPHNQFQGHQNANISPSKGQIQGHMQGQVPMQGQMPPMSLPGLPNSGMMQQLQQEALQQKRTLRNITNNADMTKSKISQMLEMNRPPPPMYPGRTAPPVTGPRPPPPAVPIYYGHDTTENVPPDMCLLGCVFYITDYHQLLGADEIKTWKDVIDQHGGEVDDSYSSRITHVLCSNQHSDVFQLAMNDQKRVVTAFWLNDCLVQKKMSPPTQGLHLPVPFGDQKPCQNQIICVTNFDGEERKRVKQLITSLGAKYTGYMTHANSVLICKKPEGIKYQKAKEWKIPVVNVQWLTDLVCGHLEALRLPVNPKYQIPNAPNLFLLDSNLVARLLVGWRSPLKIAKETWKNFISKPKPSQDQENIPQNGKRPHPDNDIDEVLAKKPRLEPAKSSPSVLFTGFPNITTKKLTAIAEHLGLNVVQNARECSHVIMPSLSRTMKLFEAISVCKYVLTKEWLEASLNQEKLLDEEKYLLRDIKAEKEFGCCLVDSIHRAQIKPLYQGIAFYLTPSVVPSVKDFTKIIVSAGGTVVNRRPSAKTIINMVSDKGKPTFIVITCNNDLHLCRDLFAQKINVYNAEFILTSVLRQELDFSLFTVTIPT
ncbi:hypothetical protein SNE40_006628 [Patella caerulea]|uniref:PAX-interacting protein 1 n=1 Tax=Patella caerulea TaxID=87958 RepID=A0AAN8JUG8_PATCE